MKTKSMGKIALKILSGLPIVALVGLIFFLTQNNRNKTVFKPCLDCNLVFISFDTLRSDHVSALGYKRKITPTIDQFAQKGFNFTNAVSVTSWTLPSTMSWFTGVYPSEHKVLNKVTLTNSKEEIISNLKKLSPNLKTMAEVFRQNGYRTGAFTGGAGVNHQFGFGDGFDIYSDEKDFAGFEESIPKALAWVKEHKEEKFFVFLHGYDIHGQYVPKDGYDRRFVDFDYRGKLTGSKEEQKELREDGLVKGQLFLTEDDVRFLIALYDEYIQRADTRFAEFIKEYQNLDLKNKTVFIITSDHGEEFYEHGRIDHGHSLYEELLRVPLIISLPDMEKGEKIGAQVASIDLMPTIFDLVGIDSGESIRQQMTGVSLIPLIEGKARSRDIYPETDYRYATSQRSVRTADGWKLILDLETKIKEFYNLNQDPQEKKSISQKDIKTEKLEENLQEYLRHHAQ